MVWLARTKCSLREPSDDVGSLPSERSSQLRAASKLLVDADESRADFCTVKAAPACRR